MMPITTRSSTRLKPEAIRQLGVRRVPSMPPVGSFRRFRTSCRITDILRLSELNYLPPIVFGHTRRLTLVPRSSERVVARPGTLDAPRARWVRFRHFERVEQRDIADTRHPRDRPRPWWRWLRFLDLAARRWVREA